MFIERFYIECLSQASYYIESEGQAAVIDPMREIKPYLELAEQRGAHIKYVFETHFHADFVSGHIDLAKRTGASIIFGPGAVADYNIYAAKDGEEFTFGNVSIKVLHTPGHTLESCCFLLHDENMNPHSVFSGDTLFIGDVGRPDVSAGAKFTVNHLAGMLYDSIETKLKPLPNYVILYPGHGAGSPCGKSISTEAHSTIGVQKKSNYALKVKSKEDFIKQVTDGLTELPKYFYWDVAINKKGYSDIDTVLQHGLRPLSLKIFKDEMINEDVRIIDTRTNKIFEKGFIPRSINIGLNGSFAITAGSVINPETRLIIVADSGMEEESILRFARIGFEKVIGYLEGGFNEWKRSGGSIETIPSISAEEFEDQFRYSSDTLIDVRNQDEWVPGIVAGSKLIPLQNLENRVNEIDRDKPVFIYCTSGYRSMVAASLLRRLGFKNVVDIDGGIEALIKTRILMKQLTSTNN